MGEEPKRRTPAGLARRGQQALTSVGGSLLLFLLLLVGLEPAAPQLPSASKDSAAAAGASKEVAGRPADSTGLRRGQLARTLLLSLEHELPDRMASGGQAALPAAGLGIGLYQAATQGATEPPSPFPFPFPRAYSAQAPPALFA